MWVKHSKTIINHQFWNGLYHLFMAKNMVIGTGWCPPVMWTLVYKPHDISIVKTGLWEAGPLLSGTRTLSCWQLISHSVQAASPLMVDQGKTWINQNQPGNNQNHEAYQNPQHPTTSYNSYVPSMSARSRSPAVTVAGTGGALKSMWNFFYFVPQIPFLSMVCLPKNLSNFVHPPCFDTDQDVWCWKIQM